MKTGYISEVDEILETNRTVGGLKFLFLPPCFAYFLCVSQKVEKITVHHSLSSEMSRTIVV